MPEAPARLPMSARGLAAAAAVGVGVSWNIADAGAVAEPLAAHYAVGLAVVGLFTAVLFVAELGSMAAIGPLVGAHGAKLVGLAALAICVVGNLFAFNMYGDPSISFYAPGDTPPVPFSPYIILIVFVILTSAIFFERIRHL